MTKKKKSSYDNELDVVEVIKIFWDKKIIIILTIFISVLIGFVYESQKTSYFESSIEINASKYSEFVKLLHFQNNLIQINASDNPYKMQYIDKAGNNLTYLRNEMHLLDANKILIKFADEIKDYDEVITALAKNNYVKGEISNLSNYNRQRKLYDYARSFTLDEGEHQYLLKFSWHDSQESREILNQVIELSLKNLQETVFYELEQLVNIKKNSSINKDLNRIEFLIEQRTIAQKLDIKYNVLSNSSENGAYYFRGYEAINEEINLIKSRKHVDLINIQDELRAIKNSEIDWVDFNPFLINTSSNKNLRKTLIISIIIGAAIGCFYALILNLFRSQKFIK